MSAAQKVEECWDKCDDADSIMATWSGAAPMDVLSRNDSMVPATIHVRGDQPFSTLDAFIAGVSIELLSWYSRHPDNLARDVKERVWDSENWTTEYILSRIKQVLPTQAAAPTRNERSKNSL
jgi:hypothetical protein